MYYVKQIDHLNGARVVLVVWEHPFLAQAITKLRECKRQYPNETFYLSAVAEPGEES